MDGRHRRAWRSRVSGPGGSTRGHPDEVSKEMTKIGNRVDGQVEHWLVDHGKRPPKQLARQADARADGRG